MYFWTPQQFIEGRYSLGEIGDIRNLTIIEAKASLERIEASMHTIKARIALTAIRDDSPRSREMPVRGVIYPVDPKSTEAEQWEDIAARFRNIGVAGMLHAYDGYKIELATKYPVGLDDEGVT